MRKMWLSPIDLKSKEIWSLNFDMQNRILCGTVAFGTWGTWKCIDYLGVGMTEKDDIATFNDKIIIQNENTRL